MLSSDRGHQPGHAATLDGTLTASRSGRALTSPNRGAPEPIDLRPPQARSRTGIRGGGEAHRPEAEERRESGRVAPGRQEPSDMGMPEMMPRPLGRLCSGHGDLDRVGDRRSAPRSPILGGEHELGVGDCREARPRAGSNRAADAATAGASSRFPAHLPGPGTSPPTSGCPPGTRRDLAEPDPSDAAGLRQVTAGVHGPPVGPHPGRPPRTPGDQTAWFTKRMLHTSASSAAAGARGGPSGGAGGQAARAASTAIPAGRRGAGVRRST